MLHSPLARRGMVTAPHHLASEAGIRVLREGGNAVEAMVAMAAEDFVRAVLVAKLHAREVWVGPDFRFGHRRGGDVALLQRMGAELGFATHALPLVEDAGERVSSTAVRASLAGW